MLSSRTTLIGIMVVAGRKLTAPQLIRLAKAVGLSPANVKSHLSRLVTEGAVERSGPVRRATYEPSATQRQIIEEIQARLSESPDPAWDQTWLMLALRLPKNRSNRARLRATLWFDGFREVASGVFARPAWPLPWADGCARRYLEVCPGLCIRGAPIITSFELARLYDLEGLDAEACRLCKWIETRAGHSPRDAFIKRINVGGRVAQFIGHDPRLPNAVWGGRNGLSRLVEAFHRFEKRVAPQANQFVESLNQTPI